MVPLLRYSIDHDVGPFGWPIKISSWFSQQPFVAIFWPYTYMLLSLDEHEDDICWKLDRNFDQVISKEHYVAAETLTWQVLGRVQG